MTTSQRHAPQVLTCQSPAEFLASIPLMLGYVPANSIVVTLFDGKRARTAARFDLPNPSTPFESTGLDRALISILAECKWARAVAVVIYTDDVFSSDSGAPFALLAMWLERAIEMAHVAVRELACVAANGWATYRSAEARAGGRSLNEIAGHGAAFAKRFPNEPIPVPIGELASLPDAAPDLCATLVRELDRVGPTRIEDVTPTSFNGLLDACAVAFGQGLTPTTAAACAAVVQACATVRCWLIPVLFLSADLHGEAHAVSQGTAREFLDLLKHPQLTPESGGSELSTRLTMFSAERLDPGHLRTTVEKLTQLAAHTPERLRPGVLTLTAWAWWMGGMSTPALALTAEALRIVPAHPIAGTITELCDAGPPLWVFQQSV